MYFQVNLNNRKAQFFTVFLTKLSANESSPKPLFIFILKNVDCSRRIPQAWLLNLVVFSCNKTYARVAERYPSQDVIGSLLAT